MDEAEEGRTMTAIAPVPTPPATAVKTPMLAYLEGLHDQWLTEVRGALEPACEEHTGIWLRWRAIEYLETGFHRRLERERRAVDARHSRFTPAHAGHLWAAGELLAQLLESLGRRVGLCQHEQEFTAVALTVLQALAYWCQQVEEALGRVRWGELSPEARHLFEVITYDEAMHGG
jgi:hypothetical protein